MAESRLIVSVPDDRFLNELSDLSDRVDVVQWDFTTAAPLSSIDLVIPPYLGTAADLGVLRGVSTKLVQSQSIGFDGVAEALPPGQVFANAASVHEASTAELTLALILASQRGLPEFVRAAEHGNWQPEFRPSLADRTVLLIGYGGVGKAIESRLLPFECEVVRVASAARTDERGDIHGIDELDHLLPTADIVVVGVPLTTETRHLINDDFLSAMPDGALLVNIARGPVADTAALLAHTASGRLRAAVDVTDPEPLPDGHPLFTLPNVLITPHIGGASSAMWPRMVRLVRAQIDRLLAGEEPLNIVIRS
jgi:phosphoglycerate dehydrogenase-like enzyme